jgi:peptidoglycan/LPS O-acetylase OafA/YrhL
MPKSEIPQLTGLRFLAALSILILHSVAWCIPFNDTRMPSAIAGAIGVFGMPLFFVLSGFVIHYNYAVLFRDQSLGSAARNFFSARFARLYPLYFFFLVFGSVSDFVSNWISYAPTEVENYVIHTLTLTQSWVYTFAIHDRLVLNHGFGLAWSISTEVFFYVVYPFLVFAVLRIRRPRTGLIALALFSLAFMALLAVALSKFASIEEMARAFFPRVLSRDQSGDASFYRWLFYFSPYIRIGEFVVGCLTAQLFMIVRELPIARRERTYAGLVFAVAVVWMVGFAFIYGHSAAVPNGLGDPGTFGSELVRIVHFSALNFGLAVPLAIVIFYTARYGGMTANFLALPAMVWLGEISYSLYAVHTWTLRPLIRPAVSFNEVYEIDAILRVAMGIAFTIVVSAGTYTMIEKPARRYLRTLLMNGKAAKAAPYAPNEMKGT